MVTVAVAVQGSVVAIVISSTRTIPLPPLGQTANPSAMTPHCTTSHRIAARQTALCLTRTHEFFTRVLLKVKSHMELVAEKLVATNPLK